MMGAATFHDYERKVGMCCKRTLKRSKKKRNCAKLGRARAQQFEGYYVYAHQSTGGTLVSATTPAAMSKNDLALHFSSVSSF